VPVARATNNVMRRKLRYRQDKAAVSGKTPGHNDASTADHIARPAVDADARAEPHQRAAAAGWASFQGTVVPTPHAAGLCEALRQARCSAALFLQPVVERLLCRLRRDCWRSLRTRLWQGKRAGRRLLHSIWEQAFFRFNAMADSAWVGIVRRTPSLGRLSRLRASGQARLPEQRRDGKNGRLRKCEPVSHRGNPCSNAGRWIMPKIAVFVAGR
jgi:hypothetical protein